MITGKVRIIGGKWRGRKIQFPNVKGLRPSPDRVRETLFNWLSPYLKDAVCLDLFGGSGILSFEALSRGAKYGVIIEENSKIATAIQQNTVLLKIENQVQIVVGSFPEVLKQHLSFPCKFNLLFLDPPFRQGYIKSASNWLEQNFTAYLEENCFIYIEAEAELDPLPLPQSWQVLKKKKAGQVVYCLIRRSTN